MTGRSWGDRGRGENEEQTSEKRQEAERKGEHQQEREKSDYIQYQEHSHLNADVSCSPYLVHFVSFLLLFLLFLLFHIPGIEVPVPSSFPVRAPLACFWLFFVSVSFARSVSVRVSQCLLIPTVSASPVAASRPVESRGDERRKRKKKKKTCLSSRT